MGAGVPPRPGLTARAAGFGPPPGKPLTRPAAPGAAQSEPAIPTQHSIQYLRVVAALAVALAHAGHYTARAYDVAWPNLVFRGWLGAYGVAIFFAISGYLMAEIIKRQEPGEFLVRRLLRIYPTFLLAVALSLSLSPVTFFGTSGTHLALLPAGPDRSALLVEWTLVHEIYFYVGIFLLAATGLARGIPWVAAAWIAVIVAAAFSDIPHPRIGLADFLEVPIMYANTGLAAGLLIPSLIRRWHAPKLFAAVFLATLPFAEVLPDSLLQMGAGLAAALLVGAAIQGRWRLPGRLDRVLLRAGDWSYGLYLIHVPVIRSMLFYLAPSVPAAAAFPAVIAGMLAAGCALGVVDVALHKRARAVAASMARRPRLVASVMFAAAYCAAGLWYAL